jgi:predicted S18 family serine protease
VFLIIFIIYGFSIINNPQTETSHAEAFEHSNEIRLLAVTEDDNGNVSGGSIIKLKLKVKEGSGNTYISLKSIKETDTQISIINSKKIACNLYKLDCDNYDFYYEFEGSSLILKGPSASSAIAILTVKTIKEENVSQEIGITGSLSSGGIIGTVGGIEKKAEIAEKLGFKKILVPLSYEINESKNYSLEIVKVLDIIEAYNHFGEEKYELENVEINKSKYEPLMKNIGDKLCKRNQKIKSEINFTLIDENSSLNPFKKQAETSFNNSENARLKKDDYSRGSFCYNSNINYRIIIENQKNQTNEDINAKKEELKNKISAYYDKIHTKEFKENITTINDFYIYLLLNNRIEEAKNFIENYDNIEKNRIQEINKLDNLTNQSTNKTNATINISSIAKGKIELNKNFVVPKIMQYSYALERFETVKLWQEIITHEGSEIEFNEMEILEACLNINKEIYIKEELMKKYNINVFDSEISKQKKLQENPKNKYLCIYNGLELNAKINTVINSVTVSTNESKRFSKILANLTKTRIPLNSGGEFPLIPYIYYEYAKELSESDPASSILYSNYALSYADLNLYIDKKDEVRLVFEKEEIEGKDMLKEMFENPLFLLGLLLLVAFV